MWNAPQTLGQETFTPAQNKTLIEYVNTFFQREARNLCYPRADDFKLLNLHKFQCFRVGVQTAHKLNKNPEDVVLWDNDRAACLGYTNRLIIRDLHGEDLGSCQFGIEFLRRDMKADADIWKWISAVLNLIPLFILLETCEKRLHNPQRPKPLKNRTVSDEHVTRALVYDLKAALV